MEEPTITSLVWTVCLVFTLVLGFFTGGVGDIGIFHGPIGWVIAVVLGGLVGLILQAIYNWVRR